MLESSEPKWAKFGCGLALIAGLYHMWLASVTLAPKLISSPLTCILFDFFVLVGALLMRMCRSDFKILGGALMVWYSFLSWSLGMGLWSFSFMGFVINLNSPIGAMSSVGLVLGISGGVLGIAEGVRLTLTTEP